MALNVALNFEDGVTRFIECRTDETVADAAYRMGINIPLDCRDGACGTCKCKVESGAYDGGSYIEDALTDDEAAHGLALACQMRPKSDCIVAIAASSHACKTAPQNYASKLVKLEKLSDTSIGFSLAAVPGLSFLSGQYVSLAVPNSLDQRRSYSFSSAPGSATLDFLVRNIPGGMMSHWLHDVAQPGAEMSFTGPSGSFYLRDITRPLLFLAGGTGLAPFLSMLGKLSETGTTQPVHLIYGVTNDPDLVGVSELKAYAARMPSFSFATVVAAAESAHSLKGYVTAHIAPEHLNDGDVDIYLCGPPPMVEAVRAWLSSQGVTPANFYYEKFSPPGATAKQAA